MNQLIPKVGVSVGAPATSNVGVRPNPVDPHATFRPIASEPNSATSAPATPPAPVAPVHQSVGLPESHPVTPGAPLTSSTEAYTLPPIGVHGPSPSVGHPGIQSPKLPAPAGREWSPVGYGDDPTPGPALRAGSLAVLPPSAYGLFDMNNKYQIGAYSKIVGDTYGAQSNAQAAAYGAEGQHSAAAAHANAQVIGSFNDSGQRNASAKADRQSADQDFAIKSRKLDSDIAGQNAQIGIDKMRYSPEGQVAAMKAIMSDPDAKTGYFAAKGLPVPPPAITPNTPINANTYEQSISQPGNAGLKSILDNKDLDLHGKLRALTGMQGLEDPNSQLHQTLQHHINSSYTPDEWKNQTHIPPDPDQEISSNPIRGLFDRATGVLNSGAASIFGDSVSPLTGIGWRTNYRDRTGQRDLLNRYGLSGPVR
jgi:hypothetical protein